MLALSSQGAATIQGKVVPMILLVDMMFSPTPMHLCSANVNVTVSGTAYQGIGNLGQIDAVQDTPSEIKQLQFSLAGVEPSMISLVVSDSNIQGTPCTVSVALLDPSTYAVTDVVPIWAGALDTMVINDGTPTATIKVSAEHLGIDLARSTPIYYTDADQQTLQPGDLFFQYTSDQFDQQIVWPSAMYFRK